MRKIAGFIAPRFPEFLATELVPRDWKVAHAGKWQLKENILRTEGRALAWREARTAVPRFAREAHLDMLVDNLPLALGMCTGRARSHHLRIPLLRISALSLASGCRFATRWIPSELNVADAPSRAWVPSKVTEQPRPDGRRHGPTAAEGIGAVAAALERGCLRPPAEAAATRLRRAATTSLPDPSGRTYLELASTTVLTRDHYRNRLLDFVQWCASLSLTWNDATPLDQILATWLNGERPLLPRTGGSGGLEDGRGDQFAMPEFSRRGELNLPRSMRAVKS